MNNVFSERLKELREEHNLTKAQLAKELKFSDACISRWENNLRLPNSESIITICKYFNVSADYLLGLTDYV